MVGPAGRAYCYTVYRFIRVQNKLQFLHFRIGHTRLQGPTGRPKAHRHPRRHLAVEQNVRDRIWVPQEVSDMRTVCESSGNGAPSSVACVDFVKSIYGNFQSGIKVDIAND